MLAALILLLGQVAYSMRTELSIRVPQLNPLLTELCSMLGCEIPLPRKAELLGIETSDLHPDPQRPHLLVLLATLQNRAPFSQAYPDLELTLTDMRDQPVVRRVFSPAEYLDPTLAASAASAGFAAHADLPVTLLVQVEGVEASGYRLYLFYP